MFKLAFVLCLMITCSLNAEINVLAFSGSTRKDSTNQKLVTEAAEMAQQRGAKVTVVNLKDYEMPFYDADVEKTSGLPPKAKQLRQLMKQSQVILIASPEYNGAPSAILKNALDWSSRDEQGQPSREAFTGKKFIIMSASPGQGGGARGLVHLRSIIENIGGTVITEQIVVPNSYEAFDAQGHLKDSKLKNELQQLISSVVH